MRVNPPRIDSIRGRSLLFAGIALQQDERTKQLAEIGYRRAITFLKINPKSNSGYKSEESAFYRLFNAIAGTTFTPESQLKDSINRRIARYEEIIGCRLNSDEFNRRLDATIAKMNS